MSSLAFSLQKFYTRIMGTRPSTLVFAAVAIGFAIFLFSGGIYDVLIQPIVAIVASGGRILTYYPFGLTEQFLGESIAIMIYYSIGVVGFLIAYRSTKYAYTPRLAYRFLLIGCALLIIAYILVEQNLLTRFS
jgi:hypothetical protein